MTTRGSAAQYAFEPIVDEAIVESSLTSDERDVVAQALKARMQVNFERHPTREIDVEALRSAISESVSTLSQRPTESQGPLEDQGHILYDVGTERRPHLRIQKGPHSEALTEAHVNSLLDSLCEHVHFPWPLCKADD